MQTCETHDECVVIFNGDDCPLCRAEEMLNTTIEELEKAMTILRKLKLTTQECSLFI